VSKFTAADPLAHLRVSTLPTTVTLSVVAAFLLDMWPVACADQDWWYTSARWAVERNGMTIADMPDDEALLAALGAIRAGLAGDSR